MSNVDWDSKLVIGSKARAPTVTKKTTDLNGKSAFELYQTRKAEFGIHSRMHLTLETYNSWISPIAFLFVGKENRSSYIDRQESDSWLKQGSCWYVLVCQQDRNYIDTSSM